FGRIRVAGLARNQAIRRLLAAIAMLSITAIVIEICAFAMRQFGIVITLTDSSCPVGIYRLTHQPIIRGELVEACLPDAIASYGRSRGYIDSGDCPNGAEPVIKLIGALSGDR